MTETPNPGGDATPWHNGVDAAILGHWQNKNYDLSNPKNVALEATKAAIEAQTMIGKVTGASKDQILVLPKDVADATGWDAVHHRLGTPKEAKDYDFAGIKFGDGTDLETGFTDAMRGALHKARVSKDAAPEIVKAVIKYLDDADAADRTVATSKLDEQKKALKTSWGTKHDENLLAAKQGARRLGVSPETVATLENALGYDAVMEMFRKVGHGTSEDTFVEGRTSHTPTAASAKDRVKELERDDAFQKRLFSGDREAAREFHALMEQIAGVAA